jgi:drug/metabolite transporter (DMT)-like permease
MDAPAWSWIPIVLLAAVAQTVRNASQKNLTATAGTIAATSVRFVFGLPFALAALAVVHALSGAPLPTPNARFLGWVALGALAQLAGTALLLAAMQQRSFVVAVAYSKTEVLQVALFSTVLLGEHVSLLSAVAIVVASVGLWLLSVVPAEPSSRGSLSSSMALLGIGSGAGFALSAVGYRAAAQALGPSPKPWEAGAYGLVWALAIQSLLIGAWLAWRQSQAARTIVREWRTSTLAGAAGALASFGWFTAFALRNAADVRTLALVEVLYGYLVSRRVFDEAITWRELAGIALLVLGIAVVSASW